MNFVDAVSHVLKNYATFTGRARRSEFWWFELFNIIVGIIANLIDRAAGTPWIAVLVGLALLLPGLAVGVRRLHDTDRSGWWWFIGLIPIVGAIILIVFWCQDSKPGSNQYGASPKYAGSHA